ncbi:hypothetical protein C2E20_8941 [Micractinium conductrix]|uniref:Uncharacterized protein n=1 Tax=Micractinium conductrix TaxID=554055 RepID=A0A2P6UZW7_9CHLO|nr:hypothetical protein C2E20_8941 [Micractinium conductrix]|eukprot:PSC67381.1 hypothetical protein C2E20_8941 [Micractinium conductrix]
MARLFLAATLLLALASAPARAVVIGEFLTEPKYAPFLKKASAAGVCLTDPSVYSGQFDLDLCPSLLKMLHALDAGETEYPVDCEPACADNFYTLAPDCLTGLTEQFNFDPAPIGVLGSRFLAICAEVHNGAGAPSPAPGPVTAPVGVPSPA